MTLRDLPGVWRRSLLAWPDGRRDTTTTVLWVQGPTLYADLRLGERQEGFAGELVAADGVFEWCHRIDLNPPEPRGDRGRLAFDGDVLVEDGADAPYVERWHRLPDSTGPSGAMLLSRPGAEAVLVRAGAYVGYATSEPEMREMPEMPVMPEISIGRVDGAAWKIGWSSRPELVGERRVLGVATGWRVSFSEGDGLS